MKKTLLTFTLLFLSLAACLAGNNLKVKMLPGEKWWGGIDCFQQRGGKLITAPYNADTQLSLDLTKDNYSNQAVSFFLSNTGRYIWSDAPVKVSFAKGQITVEGTAEVKLVQAGHTLREAYLAASAAHFPPSGEIPAREFIAAPQYNTWIELTYNQNQADILKYAHAIVDNGFPSDAVLMIDDNWQKYYGNFEFKPERFPDAKGMFDELHALGFKVMLWVCPFISPDSVEGRSLAKKGYLVKDAAGKEPAVVKWWNGYSHVVDLSNPDARAWFVGVLHQMERDFGVDGFKLDAGDGAFYDVKSTTMFDGKSYGTLHTGLWASLYKDFPYHEFRACWRLAGQPVVQRLQDKDYSWEGVASLIPSILEGSVEGHQFVCPDMIGGGQWSKFFGVTPENIDQELVVRSCQIHALMPMMQFSVAPWRVLDARHMGICRDAAQLHVRMAPYMLDQARKCAVSGEPIVRPMEYCFPGQGMEDCLDQFMLGDRYLVTPMVGPGTQREITLPEGEWIDETGRAYKGGKKYVIDVPLDRIPYFTRLENTGFSAPDLGWLFLDKGPYTLSTTVDAVPGPASFRLVKDTSLMGGKRETVYYCDTTVGEGGTLKVELGSLNPGFYQVQLRDSVKWNIGIRPEEVVSPVDAKPDFNSFWKETFAQLEQIPLQVEWKEMPKYSDDHRTCYEVRYKSFGGAISGGIISLPVKPGKYPVRLQYMGYGAKPMYPHPASDPDVIDFQVSVRDQGIFAEGQDRWIDRGLDSKENFYYRGAFCDVKRAIDFVATLDKADMSRVIAMGGSQGGALSTIAAAVDERICALAISVPFLGDYPDYHKIVWWPLHEVFDAAKKQGISREAILDMLTYFDVKNFAPRVTCPTFMAFGLQDKTCPPHTNFSIYNNLSSTDKHYFCAPRAGHGIFSDPDYRQNYYDFVNKMLKRQ